MLRSIRNSCHCIVVLSSILIILSLYYDETNSARVSRRRYFHSEHNRRHHLDQNGVVFVKSSKSESKVNLGLRRSGKYICMEDVSDEDEKIRLEARKEKHCKCPNMYAPVCGNDGVTYHNRCFMQCTSDYKYQGYSRVKLQVEKWGPCDSEHEMQP